MKNHPSFDEYLVLAQKARTQEDFISETSERLHADLFHHIVRMSDFGKGIIQVGCFEGGSLILFAHLCKVYNWPLYLIDVNADYLRYTKNLLRGLDLGTRSVFYQGNLTQFAAETELVESPVIVFVDGDHSYSAVVKDIEALYQLRQRPYATAFNDFSLRSGNPAHGEIFVDRAMRDCFGPDIDYTRIGMQFGERPIPSEDNPGPSGEYWEKHGTEGVIIEISNRELKRSYCPTVLIGEADIVPDGVPHFVPRLSPDLRNILYIPYRLKPDRDNLCSIVLIPVVDGPQSEGVLGVEIVSPNNRIICQTTVPLHNVRSYVPARLNFPPISGSHLGTFEVRVFARRARQPVSIIERRFLRPLMGLRRLRTRALCGMIFGSSILSLVNLDDGVWCVLESPVDSVVHLKQGVLSLRGWAWSREFGPGALFVEIQTPRQTERRQVRHRYCRFDVSQVIPEIPLANYAGFEISFDHLELPDQSSVTLLFEIPSVTHRLGSISVTASHGNLAIALRDIACDCCHSTDLCEAGKKDGLEIRRCQNCGLMFTSPQPEFSFVRLRYSEDYFEKEYLPLIHSTFDEALRRWNNILDNVEPFKKLSPFFFEVGTGAGYLLREAARRDWVAAGIDLNPSAVKWALELGLDVAHADILNFDLPQNKFGAIILETTLEHLLSPRKALHKCVQALHPGGGIFISTLSNEGDLFMTQGMDFMYVGPSEHLYYFSASALVRLCESVGLRVESLWRDSTRDTLVLVATKRIDRWD